MRFPYRKERNISLWHCMALVDRMKIPDIMWLKCAGLDSPKVGTYGVKMHENHNDQGDESVFKIKLW